MKAISTLFATALIATSTLASANSISLVDDTRGHVITTALDTVENYKMPTVSEANGVYISFDFTYSGVLGNKTYWSATTACSHKSSPTSLILRKQQHCPMPLGWTACTRHPPWVLRFPKGQS